MKEALRQHWPEYVMEAAGLGFFMISACAFTTLLEHPSSPVRQSIGDQMIRRVPMGIAMGLTLIAIVFSPWGKRSGAHLNPSVTLTFFRLGKVRGWDAVFYVVAQFAGGTLGVMIAYLIIGSLAGHPAVNYAATIPGPRGVTVAFIAEVVISFVMMTMILNVSNTERIARYTGLFAGALVASYITIEAPLSGMSMNPARTVGSAVFAEASRAMWLYFVAPLLAMQLAAEVHVRLKGSKSVLCAKLHHQNDQRCIFKCGYAAAAARTASHELQTQTVS